MMNSWEGYRSTAAAAGMEQRRASARSATVPFLPMRSREPAEPMEWTSCAKQRRDSENYAWSTPARAACHAPVATSDSIKEFLKGSSSSSASRGMAPSVTLRTFMDSTRTRKIAAKAAEATSAVKKNCETMKTESINKLTSEALRIWKSGSYLHADEDGRSVYIGSLPRAGGDSRHGTVWAVEPPIDAAAPLPQYARLRGAYGRYLGTPDSYGSPLPFLPVDAAQRDRDRVEMDAIMWQPVACSGSDVVGGRDARGVVLLRDRYGRYLRGSNNLLAPRRSVPVKPYVVNEHMFRWEVVRVPLSQARPELPIAAQSGFVAACFPPLLRVIEFVGEDDLDNIGEGEIWTTVETRGRSVRLLREKIAKLVGYDDFTMCVSAGRHGQFTPLLIDLLDANFEDEDTLLWEVVRVPPSEDMPELPIATQPGFFVRVCFPQPLREIQFVDEADLDNISEGENWATVQIRGRSVRLLREKIAELVGYDDFTMCVSAGRHGQFTPLLIDLPRRRETLQIVLVRPNTESYDQLIFPNPNALPSAEATDEDDPTIE
ncbi:uncharacterized protein LOC127781100 [Oryza glaberrima]|uniref:uncharacterized protein LOC127781100 n=1 Tax=Oryza glaberrima TaxID=4538 RepID=UPI00224C3472|nr:uncharacterized protein LOC127781100 [Oryza glaberrima]